MQVFLPMMLRHLNLFLRMSWSRSCACLLGRHNTSLIFAYLRVRCAWFLRRRHTLDRCHRSIKMTLCITLQSNTNCQYDIRSGHLRVCMWMLFRQKEIQRHLHSFRCLPWWWPSLFLVSAALHCWCWRMKEQEQLMTSAPVYMSKFHHHSSRLCWCKGNYYCCQLASRSKYPCLPVGMYIRRNDRGLPTPALCHSMVRMSEHQSEGLFSSRHILMGQIS